MLELQGVRRQPRRPSSRLCISSASRLAAHLELLFLLLDARRLGESKGVGRLERLHSSFYGAGEAGTSTPAGACVREGVGAAGGA